MLEKNVTLAEKIRTLFQEQGIMIASMLTAIGMAISVLVEALLSGGGGGGAATAGNHLPNDEKGVKDILEANVKPWHRY